MDGRRYKIRDDEAGGPSAGLPRKDVAGARLLYPPTRAGAWRYRVPSDLLAFFVMPLLTSAALRADGRRGACMGSVPVVLAYVALARVFRHRALRADAVLQGVLRT